MESLGHLKKLMHDRHRRRAWNFKVEWNLLPESSRVYQECSFCVMLSHLTFPINILLQPHWCRPSLWAHLTHASRWDFSAAEPHTRVHTHTHSLTATHTSSFLPKSTQTIPFHRMAIFRSPPWASPAFLQTSDLLPSYYLFALYSLLYILLVNHKLPCTLNYLVDACFLSSNLFCVPKRSFCVKCILHRTECCGKYLLNEITSLIWKHCQEIFLYSLLGL